MRLTLVSPFDPFPWGAGNEQAHVGGVERVYAETATRLAERGHDVTVVCSTDGQPGATMHQDVQVVRRRRSTTLFRAPVCRLWEAIPADTELVQVPATYPIAAPGVLAWAREHEVPSVLDFHFEPRPGSPLGRLAAVAYRAVGPRAYRQADAVMARSRSYAEEAPSLDTVDRDRLHIVPNGIDPQRFTPEGRARGEGHLLFVGRLVPYKGVGVLLDALSQAEVDVPLLVVGNGPLGPELQDKARRLDVDAHFLGHVPEGELAPLYRGAGLTVLPSVNRQEAFGITLLESMACGTPVVASDLPGVRDVAQVGGLTTPPRDAGTLAATLEAALADDTLPRGRALAERVHETYSWDAVTDRMIEVYRSVLEQAPRDPERELIEVTTGAHPGRDTLL